MSSDNNENVITDFSDGRNCRRKEDYDSKKPILICFRGRTFRLKGSIEGILGLMKTWKGKDFEEKILRIKIPTGMLFSRSLDTIFNREIVEGIYIEKIKYESASNNYIIELYLAILEQFGYDKEGFKVLFANEKNRYNVDIRRLGHVIWGESEKEYIWDLDDIIGINYAYLKIPDIYNLYNKIPEVNVNNQKMVVIDYRDGEILDGHMQASHAGELRLKKALYKKHGISVDSIIEDGRQFKVRCGFLYSNIRNHLIILDFQEIKIKSEEVDKRLKEEADKRLKEEADKRLKEEADKRLKEESRKLKHFNEYKERLKKYDLQERYDVFKTKLKEKAVEDLKKVREGFDSVDIAKEGDIEHSTDQSIEDVAEEDIMEFPKSVEDINVEVSETVIIDKTAIDTVSTPGSQDVVSQMETATIGSQVESDLNTDSANKKAGQEAKAKAGNECLDGIETLIEQMLKKGFEKIELLAEQKLLEAGRLRKLAEDDKTESIKNLAEAEGIRQLIREREEVELSIEKQLRELKKAQQDQEGLALSFNKARLDAMNTMHDLYTKTDTQDLIGYRLEIAEIGNKEIMEHIQKTIRDLGYRTELYKVDIMKKRKDVK